MSLAAPAGPRTERGTWPGREAIEQALGWTPVNPGNLGVWDRTIEALEEYHRIRGDWLSSTVAARLMGCTTRTIQRYRATLRRARQIASEATP